MPSLEDNKARWGTTFDWKAQGDEWSHAWGGTDRLWHATIWPRIGAFLPAETILEIAPGHGRISGYLLGACRRLVLVDLVESCIEQCRTRFAASEHVEYHVNDGQSLDMLGDGEVDLCVSWDSLVHAERRVMASYLRALARVLRPGGVAFLHHSNLRALRHPITGRLTQTKTHWRAKSVSAEIVRKDAEIAGLHCLVQERVPWGGDAFIDCLSLLRRPEAGDAVPTPIVVDSRIYNVQVQRAREMAELYKTSPKAPPMAEQSDRGGVISGRWGDL